MTHFSFIGHYFDYFLSINQPYLEKQSHNLAGDKIVNVLRSEDFPGVVAGDVIEIYHEEEAFPRLLLQVRSQCGSGSIRIRNYWQDPEPDP